MSDEFSEEERARLLDEFASTRSEAARDAVTAAFLPLADYFARRYSNRSVELDDLQQVARLGLVKSIDRYDPTVGVRFSTFAGRTIDGELKRWFRDKSWAMRVPRSIKENVREVTLSQQKLEQRLNAVPTALEIAADTKLDLALVIEALDARSSYQPARLDVPTSESGSQTLGEVLLSEDASVDRSDVTMMVSQLLKTVSDRDREIIEMRYFEELSQQQIADRIGLSQMQVSRILRKALGELQAAMRDPSS